MARPAPEIIELAHDVEQTAEWRRRLIEQFPLDVRLIPAAEFLEELLAELLDTDQLQQGPAVSAYVNHRRSCDWTYDDSERLADYLKTIGFQRWPTDAEDLCNGYLGSIGVSAEAAI